MQPTGLAFAIGGNDATATYNSATGAWTAGPKLPGNQDSADGAASILPDGNVLFDASPGVFNSPTHFFVWNGSTITQVADTAEASSDSSYVTRFVVLPTGQVMFDDGTGDIEIFNADQTANLSCPSSITSISSTTLKGGATYSLKGTQLSGRSDGAAYGDDIQDNTNFPLVRITNSSHRRGHLRENDRVELGIRLLRAPRRHRRDLPCQRRRRLARARSRWSPTESRPRHTR